MKREDKSLRYKALEELLHESQTIYGNYDIQDWFNLETFVNELDTRDSTIEELFRHPDDPYSK